MASMEVSVPIEKFASLLKKLGPKADAALNRGVLSAAMRSRDILVSETQKKKVFNTGYYQGAWKADRVITSKLLGLLATRTVHVYNQAPYAGVIEYGRRPYPNRVSPRTGAPRRPRGSGPLPMDSLPPFRKAIAAWVMRKFGLPYERAYPLMWAISNSINKKGIPARNVLTDAVPQLEKALVTEVTRELQTALKGKP